jgi:hypothetical protein
LNNKKKIWDNQFKITAVPAHYIYSKHFLTRAKKLSFA